MIWCCIEGRNNGKIQKTDATTGLVIPSLADIYQMVPTSFDGRCHFIA